MKQDRLYRFNIQFTPQSEAEERAGEFLNSLSRRKSTIIVAAVIEYMQNHPETTLAELMANTKSQELLSNSGYKPKF